MDIKRILLVAGLIVLAVVIFMSLKDEVEEDVVLDEYNEILAISGDTTLTDPVVIPEGESYVVEDGATVTFNEPATINGAIGCRGGDLTLIFKDRLELNDTVVCETDDAGLTIVVEGGLTMGSNARIVAEGNVQIVDSQSGVRDERALQALYDAVETVPESGIVVGPLLEDDAVETQEEEPTSETEEPQVSLIEGFLAHFVRTAHAQVDNGTTTVNLTGEPIVVSGKIQVKGPVRRGAKRVVVFDFPNTPSVTVQNFELSGPEGRPGDSDTGSCDVTGKDGEDAFRFNAFAPSLTVNNFTLRLGDGGEGGEAVTGDGCDDARAKGGNGGKPGNFRMIGAQEFKITGAFNIHPGNGGPGGGATAKGKQGDPGEKGGDAHATGGKGADNKKKLSVAGTVAGTNNVQFGDAVAGSGGSVLAEGGKGGDADKCGMNGGPGGTATAKSGDGGDAKLTVSGGAGRMEFAADIGGKGGIVEAYGGAGGTGGSCGEEAKGGDGGKGGNANATEGRGGQGSQGRASDGTVLGDDGGDGGNGGDGCTEGIGGEGGSGGIEDGEKGEDGKNLCITVTKEEDYISLAPGEIEVIQYMDYYIPISSLRKFTDESGGECDGEEHWHPGQNGAINTMGMAVPDPDSAGCGFGKTSEVPVLIMQDPNYVEESETEVEGEGGGMIQIDPPVLIIPAGVSQ